MLNMPPTGFDSQEDLTQVRGRHKVWWDGDRYRYRYRPPAHCIVRAVPMDPTAGPTYAAPHTACAL